MVKIGIIGYGYWGPNLVRNFSSVKNCTVSMVADMRDERLALINNIYPGIKTTKSADDLINSKEVDAVVIATPVYMHYPLAKQALNANKHVLLEKPMTASSDHARELIDMAIKNNRVLMIDHTFLYTGAVQKIHELTTNNELGSLKYFDSTRINLGLFQPDINVLWDLAPHDISILTHVMSETPISVNATGISHTHNQIENVAYMTVNYQSDFIAHFHCSWTSPVKIRLMLIGGDKKMIVYDDMETTEKVKVYDTGYDFKTDEEKQRMMVDYRTGDIYIPKVAMKEALGGMASDFIDAIMLGTEPISNWRSGLANVQILEAAQLSIKSEGRETKLAL